VTSWLVITVLKMGGLTEGVLADLLYAGETKGELKEDWEQLKRNACFQFLGKGSEGGERKKSSGGDRIHKE